MHSHFISHRKNSPVRRNTAPDRNITGGLLIQYVSGCPMRYFDVLKIHHNYMSLLCCGPSKYLAGLTEASPYLFTWSTLKA